MVSNLLTAGFFVVFAAFVYLLIRVAIEGKTVKQATNYDCSKIESRMNNQNCGTPGAEVVKALRDVNVQFRGVEEIDEQRI